MHNRLVWMTVFLVVSAGGLLTWSLTRGQEPAPRKAAGPKTPAANTPARSAPQAEEAGEINSGSLPLIPDKDKKPSPADDKSTSSLRQQVLVTAQRGADWLFRMNGLNGRFLAGCNPALNVDLEGDQFMPQAGAAWALARAARLTKDERYAARATQAIVLLLGETAVDAKDARLRYTSLPSALLNRLGAAGMLILAINELPAPQKDILDQSEQLCNFIRSNLRADGSLSDAETSEKEKPTSRQQESDFTSSAQALCGVAMSQKHRPAPWKAELLRKTLPFHVALWKSQKNLSCAPYLAGAFTEAFLQTKEASFAEFVFEIGDWLSGLQYDRLDPNHADWWGGFMTWQNGKAVAQMPDMTSAAAAEVLVSARWVAQAKGDPKRFEKYEGTLELALQYVARLQYTQANTRHFADWYHGKLLGGFHASQQDGTLRLEFAQHAVCAFSQYALHMSKNASR